MKVKRLSVSGLGKPDTRTVINFYEDLNILTGKNGSGKTTALKLVWYLLSGNIEHAASEIPFTEAVLETDLYNLTVTASGSAVSGIKFEHDGEELNFFSTDEDEEFEFGGDPVSEADDHVAAFGSSVFFPTFRRIEGGFSIKRKDGPLTPRTRTQSALEDAMSDLARRMTVANHTFISSISTIDIVQLLMRQYTDMSERSNSLQQQTSQEIIDRIKDYRFGKAYTAENPENVLDNIKLMIETLDSERETILAPLNAVRVLAERLFQHAGIRLGARLSFGDAAKAVSSDSLSAGEKQMLSFICYNAFYLDSVIFIDEPELSLHVDWQRQLFSIMQDQGTGNQFIVATHSPFIYGKFPDREIIINQDRGDRGSQGSL